MVTQLIFIFSALLAGIPRHSAEKLAGDILNFKSDINYAIKRKGLAYKNYRWPNGDDGYPIIPYRYGNATMYKLIIENGINLWKKDTCIRFEEVADQLRPHIYFIQSKGCWSKLGMQSSYGNEGQPISIVRTCAKAGSVAHEIGHALGMFHEQSRLDRNNYIKIINDSIEDGFHIQFHIQMPYLINNFSLPYDYSSIMHYGSKTYSKNYNFTIETIEPIYQGLIGQREKLSHFDKLLANTMYGCIDKWMEECNLEKSPCLNHGYLGQNCKCICPQNTQGDFCQQITGGYYDKTLSKCSEYIWKDGINITSFGFQESYQPGERCIKVIRAPECHVPQLIINKFHLSACAYDTLMISFNHGFSGVKIYCNNDLNEGDIITSDSQDMTIYTEQNSGLMGWSASLKFIPDLDCRLKAIDHLLSQKDKNNSEELLKCEELTDFGLKKSSNCDFQLSEGTVT